MMSSRVRRSSWRLRSIGFPRFGNWREGDLPGLGKAAQSPRSRSLVPRIDEAEHVANSVRLLLRSGCGQLVCVGGRQGHHIERYPASPISRGRLCTKGQATKSYAYKPLREYKVKYRGLIDAAARQLGIHRPLSGS